MHYDSNYDGDDAGLASHSDAGALRMRNEAAGKKPIKKETMPEMVGAVFL